MDTLGLYFNTVIRFFSKLITLINSFMTEVHISFFFFLKKKNWDSLHVKLNSYYEALSYKKKKHEKVKG